MNDIKNELQELIRQQKKTTRALEQNSYRGMFFFSGILIALSKDKQVDIFCYVAAGLSIVLQIIVLIEDIMDTVNEFDDETELDKIEV